MRRDYYNYTVKNTVELNDIGCRLKLSTDAIPVYYPSFLVFLDTCPFM